MAGSVAANFHQGSRSELLADYLFSTWGTVTPVRRQDDYGVDLFCTLTARSGQRAVVSEHYSVQVKSSTAPWVFEDEGAVRWLIQHPTPLFLACVDKSAGVLSVYHLTPRFYVWAMGTIPPRLELVPEDIQDGRFVSWEHRGEGGSFSLSAPILRVSISDLVDGAVLDHLREVLECWVRFDQGNCDLVRQGLLRFRMPYGYRVNELPGGGLVEQGLAAPAKAFLGRGILTTSEGAECIGGQLGRMGDRRAALFAALLVDHLQRNYPDAFQGATRWRRRLPGDLGQVVCLGLNQAMEDGNAVSYYYRGIDAVTEALCSETNVRKFLSEGAAAGQALSGDEKRPVTDIGTAT